jgi:hypothetical protein
MIQALDGHGLGVTPKEDFVSSMLMAESGR